MRVNLPSPDYFIGKEVPGLTGYKIEEKIGSGNNAHVFRARSDDTINDLACKVIPRNNLRPGWRAEIEKANIIRSPIGVRFYSIGEWSDDLAGIDCVVLCSEYVRGPNLEKYVKGHKQELSVAFCESFLEAMFSLIHDMENHHVRHGDLHSKNILVEDRSDQLGDLKHAFRVTDFGVGSTTSDASFKDDYEQVAANLRTILENIDYQSLGARDRYAFNILNDHFLARHLIENDLTRDNIARNPSKLYDRLHEIDVDFNRQQKETNQISLATPFDFLSCEQIGDAHSLLKALYSDAFLGLPEIEDRNNMVLTGPRGCGKSTVYKSLSLRHRVLSNSDLPDEVAYIGIYYRCDDLYSIYPRYSLPSREEGWNLPIHFLTVTLVAEMLASIEMWASNNFKNDFSSKERTVAAKIWEVLGFSLPEEPGSNTFKALHFKLQKERKRTAEKQRFVHDAKRPIGDCFGPEVLPQVCAVLLENFSFLQNRPFYFFIDDYSAPKISKDLQKNLNRLLMQRTAYCFFKLATESPVSYTREDIDGKAYVEGREFILLNLGLVYLNATKSKEKLQFIEDVFKRRFKAVATYPVSNLDELIGSYPVPIQTEIALAIRRKEKPEMWGKEILGELCSGDIFYILSLVHRMVSNVGGSGALVEISSTPKIKKEGQKQAIREEAGSFLNNLRGIPNGEHLVAVVTSFGNVAYSYLRHRNSKNIEGNPPHLASRIEPYEELDLSSEARNIYDELLRYSLFLEDPRGKSRRGKLVPRLYLRRALLPHFNLTFSNRDSIELEGHDIEQLLLDPKEFENQHRLRKDSLEWERLPLWGQEEQLKESE